MTHFSFRFTEYAAQLVCEPLDLQLMDAVVREIPREALRVHRGREGYQLLSPQGSTQGSLTPWQLRLHTHFFDGFEEPEAHGRRDPYFLRKLAAVAEALQKQGASLSFVGVTQRARARLDPDMQDEARQAVREALVQGRGLLSASAELYDFSLRVSRYLGDSGFFNTTVSWYQTRVYRDTPLPPGQAVLLQPWQGEVEEEGIELLFDMNNKRGLFEGKKDWTWEEMRDVVEEGMRAIEPALSSLRSSIENAWPVPQ